MSPDFGRRLGKSLNSGEPRYGVARLRANCQDLLNSGEPSYNGDVAQG